LQADAEKQFSIFGCNEDALQDSCKHYGIVTIDWRNCWNCAAIAIWGLSTILLFYTAWRMRKTRLTGGK
jgi:hypothetical protein